MLVVVEQSDSCLRQQTELSKTDQSLEVRTDPLREEWLKEGAIALLQTAAVIAEASITANYGYKLGQ